MGLIQSCLGKKSKKVGVLSEEEEYAYRKMEEEIKKEEVDDIIQTKPLPWLMFAAKPNNPDYKACSDPVNSSTVTEVIEKKGPWHSALSTSLACPNSIQSTSAELQPP